MVLEMLALLVMLAVLEKMVMFAGGIFERVKSPNFLFEKVIEFKKKIFGKKNISKTLKIKSEIHVLISPPFTNF